MALNASLKVLSAPVGLVSVGPGFFAADSAITAARVSRGLLVGPLPARQVGQAFLEMVRAPIRHGLKSRLVPAAIPFAAGADVGTGGTLTSCPCVSHVEVGRTWWKPCCCRRCVLIVYCVQWRPDFEVPHELEAFAAWA